MNTIIGMEILKKTMTWVFMNAYVIYVLINLIQRVKYATKIVDNDYKNSKNKNKF